ncbi:MAG: class I SAM-dependent RNA methyltransferase [Anaerolineae bacterium]|nr:class I SAM-dependent RNA methyltransferase [Anaerolineae bacterium]
MSDIFELDLTTIAHGGAALGRHHGRTIFVPYALPGEHVTARVVKDKGRFAYAEAIEINTPSPNRIEPPCPYFGPGRCGGCQWQHIAYGKQLEYKQTVVSDQLTRIGKFREPVVHATMPSPNPWEYRVYMTFTLTDDGKPGLWSTDNNTIIPIEACHILDPALTEIYGQLDLASPEVRRIKFQVGSHPEDRMLILETNDNLAPEIEVDIPVSVNLLLSDNEPVNLIGSSNVTYQIGERGFRVTAGGFFQTNLPMAEVLVGQVLNRLELQGNETVLDLYSGVGLFSAFIAECAGLVISAESYPPAVTDAEENLDDFTNIDIIEGSVEAVLEALEGPVEAAIVDPPRTGLQGSVIKEIARLAIPRLIYVSCDPATFARDAGQLARHGYRLLDVQPIDMFPQTFHVESVATLVKDKG